MAPSMADVLEEPALQLLSTHEHTATMRAGARVMLRCSESHRISKALSALSPPTLGCGHCAASMLLPESSLELVTDGLIAVTLAQLVRHSAAR